MIYELLLRRTIAFPIALLWTWHTIHPLGAAEVPADALPSAEITSPAPRRDPEPPGQVSPTSAQSITDATAETVTEKNEQPAEKAAAVQATEQAAEAANRAVETETPASTADEVFAPVEPPALFANVSRTDPAGAVPLSQNVTINLINRLVQRGALTKEDAVELIALAEQDAATARAQAVAAPPAPPPPTEDSVRVTYVPEVVKKQIRAELREEVLEQAREENWANPRVFPDWLSRFRFFADLRVRDEGLFYPEGNDNTGAFPNFNAINTGAPFDVAGTLFSPQYNVDQDRNRIRLRARFGFALDLGDNFTAGLRIATGDNNGPTSTNQTLGGSGGNFSKYAIWLDRAFLKYQLVRRPDRDILSLTLGRFDNPFFSTMIIWDDDVGFDGVALEGQFGALVNLTPFFSGGAFPVFNTDLNFASNQPSKFESDDKYLYAIQAGADWRIDKKFTVKVAGTYYRFDNVEGELSDPFVPLSSQDAGNTDATRPSFAQRGNTYFPIRNILPTPDNNFGTINQFQYFGLATPFENVAFTGRLDFSHFDPFHIALVGEWVKNLAFDEGAIDLVAVNNRGPDTDAGEIGPFEGGDTGWTVDLRVGAPAFEKSWDWYVSLGYRYVESDAVVDAFADSDFGVGGTNLKGFTIGAGVALTPRVSLNLRFYSAENIAGPTFKNDTFQFDVNAKF